MITKIELLERIEIDTATLDTWIEEAWLLPERGGDAPRFSDSDVARARLIRDLIDEIGVNPAGIGIALNLIDQIHGLRSALREVLAAARDRIA